VLIALYASGMILVFPECTIPVFSLIVFLSRSSSYLGAKDIRQVLTHRPYRPLSQSQGGSMEVINPATENAKSTYN
jgi:hypothetical protein